MSNVLKFGGLALLVALMAACNTVEGAGEDIEAGGEAISDAAETVEDDIKD
jgi:entericidin B